MDSAPASTPHTADTTPAPVTLRYWASARAAAGTDADVIEVAGTTSLADLLRQARALHPGRRFADVVDCCSVMVGDRPVTTDDPAEVAVAPGSSVELLPPFAGG